MRPTLLLAALLTAGCVAQAPTPAQAPPTTAPAQLEFINLYDPWPYPFSSATRVGNLIFVSGQIGTEMRDGKPALVAGGLDAEAKQTMENIRAILARAGSSLDRVAKCNVIMADMSEWPRLNEIYATYFPGAKPARAAWGATGLALGARVEIDCIAVAQ